MTLPSLYQTIKNDSAAILLVDADAAFAVAHNSRLTSRSLAYSSHPSVGIDAEPTPVFRGAEVSCAMTDKIPMAYLQHAAKVLTTSRQDGGGGLSGNQAVELSVAYAYDFGVDVKYARYPNEAPNKRTMLLDNLTAFEPKQQYQIVRELCDRVDPMGEQPEIVKLKTRLFTEFADFADEDQLTDMHRTLLV